MSQRSRDGWEVYILDESPRGVVAEAVRVDVWHIGATAQHRQCCASAPCEPAIDASADGHASAISHGNAESKAPAGWRPLLSRATGPETEHARGDQLVQVDRQRASGRRSVVRVESTILDAHIPLVLLGVSICGGGQQRSIAHSGGCSLYDQVSIDGFECHAAPRILDKVACLSTASASDEIQSIVQPKCQDGPHVRPAVGAARRQPINPAIFKASARFAPRSWRVMLRN